MTSSTHVLRRTAQHLMIMSLPESRSLWSGDVELSYLTLRPLFAIPDKDAEAFELLFFLHVRRILQASSSPENPLSH